MVNRKRVKDNDKAEIGRKKQKVEDNHKPHDEGAAHINSFASVEA
jgi:hypothetical protein